MTSPILDPEPDAATELDGGSGGASPEATEAPSTVGLGGCLGGFLVGGLTLWGGNALLSALGLRGGLRTGLELAVMGLSLGACLFFWKVAATADRMARKRAAEAEAEAGTEPEP